MVQLEARKEKGCIIISEDSFEHLLNCLDNQKNCSLEEYQVIIDDFKEQCRDDKFSYLKKKEISMNLILSFEPRKSEHLGVIIEDNDL